MSLSESPGLWNSLDEQEACPTSRKADQARALGHDRSCAAFQPQHTAYTAMSAACDLNSNLHLTQRQLEYTRIKPKPEPNTAHLRHFCASDIMCVWMPVYGHMSQSSILQQL
jgi:hypothetical protein